MGACPPDRTPSPRCRLLRACTASGRRRPRAVRRAGRRAAPRVSSYWGDLRDRRQLRRMMHRVARIEALVCDSAHEAAWAERNLLERSLPPWNRIVGGGEVPVSIRLDPSPEAPRLGLASVHRPARGVRCFGPYLGARRVGLAVPGLERLPPIGHAGPPRTAGERELAAARRTGHPRLAAGERCGVRAG